MSDSPSCGQSCSTPAGGDCATCPAHAPLGLDAALARFLREAVQGVCTTDRYRMPYYTWGAGPPLVLIHGFSDSRWSFVPVAARLSAHFRCIAYDLPNGHDDGARLWRYRHEHLIDDLCSLLDHLDVGRGYVLGSSFGSTVALRALHARPERFPRAVLQGGLAYRPLRRAERWLSWLARLLPGPAARIPKREKILELVHREAFAGHGPEVWRAFVHWTGQARLAAMGHQAQWLHGVDLRAELPAIRQPVLLLHGECDTVIPLAHVEMLQAGLPAAGVVVLEGCGHVPGYTHPDAFAEVVRQFLTPPAQTGGPAAGAPPGRHPLPCQG